MRVHIYTLRFNPITGGGSHHSLEIFIRALIAGGHTPVLTTFFSDDNNYSDRPCEMLEERFRGGFKTLQRHVAKRMHEHLDADIHWLYSSYIIWAGGVYKSGDGIVPVAATLNNYTPGMGLNRAPPHAGGFVQGIFAHALHDLHIMKWYIWEKSFGTRLVRKIDRLYFDSPVIQKQYRKFGYTARSSIVIPAPMEKIAITSLPLPFGRGEKIFHVIFAGRLLADKGPDLLAKAALRLPDSIHIHFIGSGSEENNLKSFVNRNNLSERVFFYGWKKPDELYAFYKNADVFVQPARWPEPFGRTTADAMACGLPIIATENTGSAWVAGDGGVTFKKNNAQDLVRCVLFFFNNPQDRAEYAKKAVIRARIFEADTISRQFVTDMQYLSAQ